MNVRWVALAAGLGGYLIGSTTLAANGESSDGSFQISNARGDSLTLSGQSGFGIWFNKNTTFGRNKANFGHSSANYQEWANLLSLDGKLGLGETKDFGELYGVVSGVASWTLATEPGEGNTPAFDAAFDSYAVGWRSADSLPALGKDALDLSLGAQPYQIGTGFLFWAGADNGGQRGASWAGMREAFERTAILKLTTHGATARLAYLEPNDNPHTNTKLVTTDLEYDFADIGSVGGGFSHIFQSDIDTRDGMDVWDLRADLTPLKPAGVLPGVTLLGEYALEDTGDRLGAHAWYGEIGYDFAGTLPWAPYLAYRYATFGGGESEDGKSKNFDPLFADAGGDGNQAWGTWVQGEILGEWLIENSNLNSHNLRLVLNPSDALQIYLLYYHFSVDNKQAAAVTASDFAHEVDLIGAYALSDNVSFTGVLGWSHPETAAEETFDGADQDWLYSMLYVQLSF